MTKATLTAMSVQELETYIREQEPIKEAKMQKAYGAQSAYRFQELSERACKPIWKAGLYLRKKKSFIMSKHGDGDLMTLEEFKGNCDGGMFIDNDGYGKYATEKEESNVVIRPSDFESGVYREDFTHVMWYNK